MKTILIKASSNFFELELISNEKKQFAHLKLVKKVYESFLYETIMSKKFCRRRYKIVEVKSKVKKTSLSFLKVTINYEQ